MSEINKDGYVFDMNFLNNINLLSSPLNNKYYALNRLDVTDLIP